MNSESNAQKTKPDKKAVEKNKKVGADGLSKQERRALKVAASAATTVAENRPADVPKPTIDEPTIIVAAKDETVKSEGDGTSKAALKAKRRAVQEAQRLAKTATKPDVKPIQNVEEPTVRVVRIKENPIKKPVKTVRFVTNKELPVIAASSPRKVQLFIHLYFENVDFDQREKLSINSKEIHPAFSKLAARYSSKTILGSNARCLAFLSALKQLVRDYRTPPKQELCRSLEVTIQNCTKYIQSVRPLAVSMINALRHFKLHLTQMDTAIGDSDKKSKLLEGIDSYIRDEIDMADQAISICVQEKIANGDCILTYGCSSLIKRILLDAHNKGKKFQVIVVDGRPLLEGREMLRMLVNAGLQCTYVLINAASYVMGRATKIILGAHALLANGSVMSRIGTAQVAMIANTYNKPVLVCCETYKFCERVQTDSFVYNEIDDPDKLAMIDTLEKESPLTSWKNMKSLTPLNLMYDVTPPDLVTAVVTELAILPCTSVPVILRIKPTEII